MGDCGLTQLVAQLGTSPAFSFSRSRSGAMPNPQSHTAEVMPEGSKETPPITPEIRKARYKAFEAFDSFSAMVVRREARICLHSNRVSSQIPFPRH